MTRDALVARIVRFIDSNDGDLDALLLDVHRFQRDTSAVVAALTDGDPSTVSAIPAVPVSLFKEVPVGEGPVVFRTSGTTEGRRGEHRLRDTLLYDHNALSHARRCVPGMPDRIVALMPDAPDSSLAHMVRLFGDVQWNFPDYAPITGDVPVFVAATAFALADYLARQPRPLPAGSVLMVTGGFKGRTSHLDHDALYEQAGIQLRPDRCVTEYGMTELSSQLWGEPDGVYVPPPWLRVVAVDAYGRPAERGQLRFYDLCNLDSTVGIETLDEGIVHPDGTLTLLGRLPGAPARGCSLTAEEARR